MSRLISLDLPVRRPFELPNDIKCLGGVDLGNLDPFLMKHQTKKVEGCRSAHSPCGQTQIW